MRDTSIALVKLVIIVGVAFFTSGCSEPIQNKMFQDCATATRTNKAEQVAYSNCTRDSLRAARTAARQVATEYMIDSTI